MGVDQKAMWVTTSKNGGFKSSKWEIASNSTGINNHATTGMILPYERYEMNDNIQNYSKDKNQDQISFKGFGLGAMGTDGQQLGGRHARSRCPWSAKMSHLCIPAIPWTSWARCAANRTFLGP